MESSSAPKAAAERDGFFVCPYTRAPLRLEGDEANGDLVAPDGRKFRIQDGIAVLMDRARESWSPDEEKEYAYYEATSAAYDAAMDWMFQSFYEDESAFREKLIAPLGLKPGARVLETGCGTCRDSVRIASKIGRAGELFLQDLSQSMLRIGKARMEAQSQGGPAVRYVVGNASTLPFPDGFFDAVFHFGGINVFTDRKAALSEMARVAKPGGRVVVGDEGLAPWMKETEFGRILQNSNALYKHRPPIEMLPENVRDVAVHWLLGNAYYAIAFTKAERGPRLNLDLPIPSRRGGTHRTRFYGVVEGVSPETKALAKEAATKAGMTESEWLDAALRERARAEINKKS